MEFLDEQDKVYSIGQLYFTAIKNSQGKLVSQYEGVIAGFIVRRDDNSEFEVRSTQPLPFAKQCLTRADLEHLKIGDPVQGVIDRINYTVLKVFPTYGDVWVKDPLTGKTSAKKMQDLKRV